MIKYEDECMGCSTPAYPCLGSSCPNRHVKHLYCDKCGDDVETLYNGLCAECYLELCDNIEKVDD